MSLKALLTYVLDEVAIDGAEGTTIPQLFQYVNDFYIRNHQDRYDLRDLCKATSPESDKSTDGRTGEADQAPADGSGPVAKWGFPNVKEDFQEYVWDLMKEQKELNVGENDEGRGLSLKNIVNQLKATGETAKEWRVYASEEIRWRVLTGHGPDPKRVPKTLWKCLEAIAKSRETGIIQPDLTKVTGQDKRSIAQRTSDLRDMGYVEKVPVLARSMNTSKLTLMKFAVERQKREAEATKAAKSQNKKGSDAHEKEKWTGDVIHTEGFIKATIAELKAARNMTLLRNDLKLKLGMDKTKFHSRSLSRMLRRIEQLGVWKRVRVPIKVNRSFKAQKGKRDNQEEKPQSGKAYARCLKLMRDMTPEDWQKISNAYRSEITVDDEADDDDLSDNGQADVGPDAASQLQKVNIDEVAEDVRRIPPIWTPSVPIPNLIYNLVHAAGSEGISSMDLVNRVMGHFYYRPVDQILHRLTDFPARSQPAQYRTLAVIRETSITQRQTHYRYFSYEHHKKLVEEGMAVEPWTVSDKKGSKKVSQAKSGKLPTEDEFDEYGFRIVNPKKLLRPDGTATLAECQAGGLGKKGKNGKVQDVSVGSLLGKRPRGRPRKNPQEPKATGRPRGRPKKQAKAAQAGIPTLEEGLGAPARGNVGNVPASQEVQDVFMRDVPTPADGAPTTSSRGSWQDTNPRLLSDDGCVEIEGFSENRPKEVAVSTDNLDITVAEAPLTRSAQKVCEQNAEEAPPTEAPGVRRSTRKRKAENEQHGSKRPKVTEETLLERAAKVNATPPKSTASNTTLPSTARRGRPRRIRSAASTPISPVAPNPELPTAPLVKEGSNLDPPPREPIASNSCEQPGESDMQAAEGTVEPNNTMNSRKVDDTLIEVDKVNQNCADYYNSIGGMLALGRQQIVLDFLAENNGVFPGGMELRHAFNRRYRDKHPKAGLADRRLIRGIVQSLQYKKKAYQITFNFTTSRGVPMNKKLIAEASVPLGASVVTDMIRKMIAADGKLWFPPGTLIPADVEDRMINPPASALGTHAPQTIDADGGFDRLFPSAIQLVRKQRAAVRAARNAAKSEEKQRAKEMKAAEKMRRTGTIVAPFVGKFSELQKEEARLRSEELKAQSALYKLNQRYNVGIPGQESSYDQNAPKSIWWKEYVARDDNVLEGIRDVQKWENLITQAGQIDALKESASKTGELVMVNHLGPEIECGVNFQQAPVEITNAVLKEHRQANVMRLVNPPAAGPSKPPEKIVMLSPNDAPAPKKRKRRRAPIIEKKSKGPNRRQLAMTAIYQNSLKKAVATGDDLTKGKESTYRNKFTIPKADEDTLLITVIVTRSLFGGFERKIDWSLVQRGVPQHSTAVLRGRWPRVRDAHKPQLKRIQTEFEERYLQAYAEGKLPVLDREDTSKFDISLHVQWFRENLRIPKAAEVPDLVNREKFEKEYNVRPEITSDWRTDHHNPTANMGARANHVICYPYEFPMRPDEDPPTDKVEYAKSVIKANIITDEASYNPQYAFEILRALPEEAVDEAFYWLNLHKVIAHKKEHSRALPGRNYELTERFHISLRQPHDERLFAQAVYYDKIVHESFEKNEPLEITPFLSDGWTAAIINLLAHHRIRLERHGFDPSKFGLIEGYETRVMSKALVDFKLVVKPLRYSEREVLPPLPSIPTCDIMNPDDIVRIWHDINGNIIPGMWLRCVTCVLSAITIRPGATIKEITKTMYPSLTKPEILDVARWLIKRGALSSVVVEGDTEPCFWAKEGFYIALEGL